MKINITQKIKEEDHLIVVTDGIRLKTNSLLNISATDLLNNYLTKNKKKEVMETFYLNSSKKLKSFTLLKYNKTQDSALQNAISGRLLAYLERRKIKKIAIFFESTLKSDSEEFIKNFVVGLYLKDYRFEKYKFVSTKDSKVETLNIIKKNDKKFEKNLTDAISTLKGVFLTRDLVSEPANELYPKKFVDVCAVLKKVGVQIEVLDEKKIKSLGMNALYGVAQGSVKPPRVMIMKWNGNKGKSKNPLAFIGKGVTFDTGGISIKPSSGMEDMKWDMGGAGVVAGLLYTLALRKAKVDVIGAVGLVENMPDGNAQRPGDIVRSMSGQTIEVLNTDAEGRLVLADVLWYINKKFKPCFMIDLATLTGAIIVALGERYAGLFSNDDKLSTNIINASKKTRELVWRMPMDNEFDKLLNCQIADMKNITGTRGAGSITAAQFLKRFVGNTSWAHLDIAGVTWSKKGTEFSRPGGTGFGVRLLDQFVKDNYEKS